MKSNIFKTGVLAAILLSSLACSQKTENAKTEKKETDKSLIVPTDSAAIEAAKKKAAAEEKAKLPKPYHPEANAAADIAGLIKKAQAENKNIMIQAGGNWCIWCLRFNNFVQTTPELKEIVDKNYIYYHLNYSPENKNEKIFAKYGNPGEKFGYPVFIVLDKNGKQIHTQDSAVLEEGKGYSTAKVKDFLNAWVPKS